MPQLREWRVAMRENQTKRTTTLLFRSGSPYLEVLHIPCRPSQRSYRRGGDDVLQDRAAAVAHPNLKRVTLYQPGGFGSSSADARALAALAPNLEVLELGVVTLDDAATGLDIPDCLHLLPNLRRLGHCDVSFFTAKFESTSDDASETDPPYLLPSTIRDISSCAIDGITDEQLKGLADAAAGSIQGGLALPSPYADVAHLERYLPMFTGIRRLDLSFRADHFFRSPTTMRQITDACVASLLRDMPALTALDVGSAGCYLQGDLTFVGEAYSGVCAPGLRELVVARIDTLRGEGIATIVRLCPNLRALDLRGCRHVSKHDFVAAVVERCVVDPAGAAAGTEAPRRPKQELALRLRKLRHVIASFRWPLPRILNFVRYDPAFFGRKARDYAQGGVGAKAT
jgi:hypothetical protein